MTGGGGYEPGSDVCEHARRGHHGLRAVPQPAGAARAPAGLSGFARPLPAAPLRDPYKRDAIIAFEPDSTPFRHDSGGDGTPESYDACRRAADSCARSAERPCGTWPSRAPTERATRAPDKVECRPRGALLDDCTV